jgi:iron complex transport system substrate-binding protein
VGVSIEAIGAACGVPLRGRRARAAFEAQLAEVTAAVASARRRPSTDVGGAGSSDAAAASATTAAAAGSPRVLLLEWLDPVFDGGHWVPGMVRAAGCAPCLNAVDGMNSTEKPWADVAAEVGRCRLTLSNPR